MTDTDRTPYGWDESLSVSLVKKLKADLKQAMLAKDVDAKNTIRQIMSEYPKITVPLTLESGKKSSRPKTSEEMTNDDILNIITSLVKSEKTVLEYGEQKTSPYLTILETYLPSMATREEIEAWINTNIDFSQFKSPMQAMRPIMQHFGKQADGNLVKGILQDQAQ
ncbi:GatB/YqeY domain-containing protein [Thermodesulfobacteriota bacterium]